jgi:glycosyltransferase involved in cell wall biosynthesis
MKIGLTIRTFYPYSGGLQAHAERLAHELCRKGHQVVIATRSISHTPSFQDFFFFSESASTAQINGLDVCVVRHARALNWLMWIILKCINRRRTQWLGIKLVQVLFTQQLIKIFKDVDAIHHVGQAHELIGFAALAAAKVLKIPLLIQPTLHPGQWGDSPLDLCLYQSADHLLVHTEYERDVLLKLGISVPIEIVGNGIEDRQDGDAERFRSTYGIGGPIILFLGRKTADKGYKLVKHAFKEVYIQHPNVTLVCMGPESTHQRTEDVDTKLQRGVLELRFGSSQDKHDVLAACTILCVPSEGESFGLVYMEAGRYKKPSIARKLPVLEELLGRQGAGLLVGTACGEGNQIHLEPTELTHSILRLLNNPTTSELLGENAYRVSTQFLWPVVVSRFEKSYSDSINSLVNSNIRFS